MNFKEININEKLQQKIKDSGFTELILIQMKCIPDILNIRSCNS
jgi:superfamily II DNA/RNA helicase